MIPETRTERLDLAFRAIKATTSIAEQIVYSVKTPHSFLIAVQDEPTGERFLSAVDLAYHDGHPGTAARYERFDMVPIPPHRSAGDVVDDLSRKQRNITSQDEIVFVCDPLIAKELDVEHSTTHPEDHILIRNRVSVIFTANPQEG